MNLKKWLAAAMSAAMLLGASACGENQPAETVQTLPTIETAPQQSYSVESIAELYNAAIQQLKDAKSYHMYGSENSTSVLADIITSAVTTVDCSYELVDGKPVYRFDSVFNVDGSQRPRTTYVQDGTYYIDYQAFNAKYFVTTNDHNDFSATDYLVSVSADKLQDVDAMDQLDGSVELQFSVPYADYESPAVAALIGYDFATETQRDDLISVKFVLDAERKLSYFYMSFATTTAIGGDQTIVVSMNLDGYDSTTVTQPHALSEYEDWSVEVDPDAGQGGVGMLDPEDVD